MEKTKVNVATIAERMKRILLAYEEQKQQNVTEIVPSTSSVVTVSQTSYRNDKGELRKDLLDFATQDYGESDTDQSYEIIDSPPKVRLQPQRAVKRVANKVKSVFMVRNRGQKVCGSNKSPSSSEHLDSSGESSILPIIIKCTRAYEQDDEKIKSNRIVPSRRRSNAAENDNDLSKKRMRIEPIGQYKRKQRSCKKN